MKNVSVEKRVVIVGAAGAIVVALMGLLGYVPGLGLLGSVREGFIPMAPSTAISFIVLGCILLAMIPRFPSGASLALFAALAALVSLFGALEVAGHFAGRDLNFECALVPDAGHLGEIPIARMSPATGAVFLLAGLAVLALVLRRSRTEDRGTRLGHWGGSLGSLVLGIGLLFGLAYLSGSPLLYGQGATVPMALTTALAFLILGAATVAASGEDAVPMSLLTSAKRGGKPISAQRRFLFMALIMVGACTMVMTVMTVMLYGFEVTERREMLTVSAQSQARLIEAVARYDARASASMHDEDPEHAASEATLSQIIDAHERYEGFNETGEFTLARRDGDSIIFVLRHRHDTVKRPAPVAFDSDLAEPMRRALQGLSGTVIGLDYRGEVVLAAHEPVGVLNLGIVVKIDLAEIRAPFIKSCLLAATVSFLVVIVGTALFFRIGNPIVERLEAYSRDLEKEVGERARAEENLAEHRDHLEELVESRTARLRESEEKYRALFERSQDAIMTLAPPSWSFTSTNPATVEMFGTKDEAHLTSLRPWDLSPETQPDERPSAEKAREMIDTAMREGSHFFEWTHERVNGEEFPATVLLSRIEWGGELMLQATVRDVTHEVQLEKQLRQAQKMEAIGTLAGGIAHDFNNILGAILGYAELAMASLAQDSDACKDIAEVMKAGHRATDLVCQILAFSRQTEQERKSVRLHPIVKEALKLLRGSLPSTIDIHENVDSDCPPVLADPTQIHQVLMNLCTNAYHAMEEMGGTLSVTLGQMTVSAEYAAGHLELSPGDYVCLSVADTGHGMDEETKRRLFEPYFTTKDEGKGTGLGLAVVHGIISRHNGVINLHSEPGEGTEFRIYLPVHDELAASESAVTEAPPRGSGEHILLVDDEEVLLEAQKRQLQRLGYRVSSFPLPEEALACFRQDAMGFDLVMTDATMPRMTGQVLTEELRTIREDIPVILVTGLNNESARDKARCAGVRAVLSKPVNLRELGETIRDVIAQSVSAGALA